ncbi:MAG: cellulase family glycosylhydrolase [Pseudomonadota bacterium]
MARPFSGYLFIAMLAVSACGDSPIVVDRNDDQQAGDTATPTVTPTAASTATPTPGGPPVGVPPGSTIRVNGGDYYLLGVNYPWKQYGGDFAGYINSNVSAITADFNDMKSKQVHVARWWIFCDGWAGIQYDANGTPTGLSSTFFQNMEKGIQIAKAAKIYLVLTFFDFQFLYKPKSTAHAGGHTNIFTDAAKSTALMNNVITPILQQYPNESTILAWEIMNEPEWVISNLPMPAGEEGTNVDGGSIPITMAQFFNVASQISTAVHVNTNAYVTIGSAALKWYKVWTNAYADQKGFPRLNLDFYQTHYYSWMDPHCLTNDPQLGTVCVSPFKQKYSDLGLDHPMVVGESPSLTSGQYDTLLSNGYAGIWPWAYINSNINWTTFTAWGNAHSSAVSIP